VIDRERVVEEVDCLWCYWLRRYTSGGRDISVESFLVHVSKVGSVSVTAFMNFEHRLKVKCHLLVLASDTKQSGKWQMCFFEQLDRSDMTALGQPMTWKWFWTAIDAGITVCYLFRGLLVVLDILPYKGKWP